MDDLTLIELQIKEPCETDDQSFVSGDTYQADLNTGTRIESPERSASGRWHTTNSSNTVELERHLSASSVSREVGASTVSNQQYDESDVLDPRKSLMSTQFEGHVYGNNGTTLSSSRFRDSREQTQFAPPVPGNALGQVFRTS